jgi:hypothetical protein
MGGQTPIERITKATANRDLQRRAGASAEHLQPFGRPGPAAPNRAGRLRALRDRFPSSSTALGAP